MKLCTLVWNIWPNQASAYAGYGTPFATLGLIAQWLAVIAFAFAIAFEPSWGKIRMHQFFHSWTNLLEGLGEILLFYILWTLEVKLTTYYFGALVIQLFKVCSLSELTIVWIGNSRIFHSKGFTNFLVNVSQISWNKYCKILYWSCKCNGRLSKWNRITNQE